MIAKSPREKTPAQSKGIISTSFDDGSIYQKYRDQCLDYEVIRSLRNDPTVQIARMAVVAPMIHTPWSFKVNKKRLPENEATDMLDASFNWARNWFIQTAIYGALDFGWQPFEVVYVNNDGVRVNKFKPLLHDITNIRVKKSNGEFAGFYNDNKYNLLEEVTVPKDYALNINLVVEGTDYYGYSVFEALRPIIGNWGIVESSASQYDRKIAGATWVLEYPVGRTPYNFLHGGIDYNDEDGRVDNEVIARDILNKLEATGAVALPSEVQDWLSDSVEKDYKNKWRISIQSASGPGQMGFIDRAKYLDALKMRVFGLPERSILEGTHGTKAESEVHTDIAIGTIDTKHRLFCDLLNQGPVQFLTRNNFGEKYIRDAWIEPAPMIDTYITTIKEIYRTIMQSPDLALREIDKMDTGQMRRELGIPNLGE